LFYWALVALSKLMTGCMEQRLQFLFVTDYRGAPTLTTAVSKPPLLAKVVTEARRRRSFVLVWMRSRLHG